MGVKAELAFDVAGKCIAGRAKVLEAKRGMSAMMEGSQPVFVAAGFSSAAWRMVADFALAGQAALAGPEWLRAWSCFAALPVACTVRERRGIFLLERAGLGELSRRRAPALWERTAAPRHVSAAKIFRDGS